MACSLVPSSSSAVSRQLQNQTSMFWSCENLSRLSVQQKDLIVISCILGYYSSDSITIYVPFIKALKKAALTLCSPIKLCGQTEMSCLLVSNIIFHCKRVAQLSGCTCTNPWVSLGRSIFCWCCISIAVLRHGECDGVRMGYAGHGSLLGGRRVNGARF